MWPFLSTDYFHTYFSSLKTSKLRKQSTWSWCHCVYRVYSNSLRKVDCCVKPHPTFLCCELVMIFSLMQYIPPSVNVLNKQGNRECIHTRSRAGDLIRIWFGSESPLEIQVRSIQALSLRIWAWDLIILLTGRSDPELEIKITILKARWIMATRDHDGIRPHVLLFAVHLSCLHLYLTKGCMHLLHV